MSTSETISLTISASGCY